MEQSTPQRAAKGQRREHKASDCVRVFGRNELGPASGWLQHSSVPSLVKGSQSAGEVVSNGALTVGDQDGTEQSMRTLWVSCRSDSWSFMRFLTVIRCQRL